MSPTTGGTRLVLLEDLGGRHHEAQWSGPLVVLGARAARHQRRKADGRQLIIALSVPKRDLAAALIGCGWVLASEPPSLGDPLKTLRTMEPGRPLRAVNHTHVISGAFSRLDEGTAPPRAHFAGRQWHVDKIQALAALVGEHNNIQEPRPKPGSLEHMAGLDLTWDARLALPAADLAIIGTLTWLEHDLNGYIAKAEDTLPPTSIRSLLKPKEHNAATWFTRLIPSARLADHLPLDEDLNAVVLDGNRAITYLNEIEAPVVICVFDRTVADETAAELVIQLRNTRGKPLSLLDDLDWSPPTGVEALAFTVAL